MHDYYFHSELVRLALVLGVVISMLFYERLQLTSGGAIVPAYLALFLPAPLQVVMTVVIAYLTYLLVSVVLARYVILYGRRKFEVEIVVGLTLLTIASVGAHQVGAADPTLVGLSGVGFVVPGVLAHDMFRQRPAQTVMALAATTAIVAVALFLFASLIAIAPVTLELPTANPLDNVSTAFPIGLLLPAIIVGVLIGIALYGRTGLRSGGFVTGTYLALVANRPLDLGFAVIAALLTYGVVRYLLMPNLLLFGRRKLSTMILVGAVIAWSGEILITTITHGAYSPWRGFTVITLIVPALLANDIQRQGFERTAWGAAIVAIGVYGAANLLDAARHLL
jgi:poly-gamma-glutamate biosynthesis protein PgsC/CapC